MNRKLKNGVIYLIRTLLISIILVEGLLWIFFPQGMHPTVDLKMTQEIPGLSSEVHFKKNGLGLRTHSIHHKAKGEDVFRIIILGASTAEQATQNNEDTWGLRLEKELQTLIPNKKVEVGIFAQGGFKTHEILRWCHQELLKLQPDLVITLFGINNLATDLSYTNNKLSNRIMEEIEKSPSWLSIIAKFSQTARYAINIQSNARRFAYTKKNNGANFDVAGLKQFRHQYQNTPLRESSLNIPTDLIKQQTQWLFKFLDQHNIPSLTLTQPSLYKKELDIILDGDRFKFKYRPASAEQAQVLIREYKSLWFLVNDGSHFIRLQPSAMRAQLDRLNTQQIEVAKQSGRHFFPLHEKLAPTSSNFFDDCHFTDAGSHKISELIAPSVANIIQSSDK